MKLYEYGLVIGRFQMLHIGHKVLIQRALELCEKVVVYIGSSQESGTIENPFSYYVREAMFEKAFRQYMISQRLMIRPLPDIGVGNSDIWGRYVLGRFEAEFNCQPDLYVTGLEKNRSSWFNDEIAPNLDELRLTRHTIDISASECRKLVREGNLTEWKKYVPSELVSSYDSYREILVGIKELPEKWVYRFEHTDPKKGAWYNKEGHYCCSNALLKQLDMPYEPDIYRGIYKASCENGKDLAYWIPRKAAEEMLSEGYVFTRYLTNDYFYRDHGEICFNKTNYIKKEPVSLEEIYD